MENRLTGVARIAAAVLALGGLGACDGADGPEGGATAAMALTSGGFSNGTSNRGFLAGSDASGGDAHVEESGGRRAYGGDSGGDGVRVLGDSGGLSSVRPLDGQDDDAGPPGDRGWLNGGGGSDAVGDGSSSPGEDLGLEGGQLPAEDAGGALGGDGQPDAGQEPADDAASDPRPDGGSAGESDSANAHQPSDDDDDHDHEGKGDDDDHEGKGDDDDHDHEGKGGAVTKSPCQKGWSGGGSNPWGKAPTPSKVFVLGAVCPPCLDPKTGSCWANHGKYVSCVTKATNEAKAKGLISGSEKGALVSAAGQSDIGKKGWCSGKACGY